VSYHSVQALTRICSTLVQKYFFWREGMNLVETVGFGC
jgi:hypothetical protein